MARLTNRLHDKTVKTAKPKDKKYELRDGNGLVLRIYSNGEKRWYYNYDFLGRRRNMMLGAYPGVTLADARQLRDDARGLVSQKIDPLTARQEAVRAARLNPTLQELAEQYMTSAAFSGLSPRSQADYKRTYETYTPDRIARLKVNELEPFHIKAITTPIRKRGAMVAAQRALAHLKSLFSWANNETDITVNPCATLKIKVTQVFDQRVLAPAEIHTFWHTLDAFVTHDSIKNALRLQLLTLTRRAEVGKAEWKHVNWAERIWTIPGANAKNSREHRLYLTDTALAVLQSQKTIAGQSKWVFPSVQDPRKHLPADSVTQAIINNRALCAFDKPFNTHDLRRTAATEATGSGAPRDHVKRTLNHSQAGDVTDRYDRYSYDREKREVLEIWERRLLEIITSNGGKGATSCNIMVV
jgi:integrase